MTRIRERFITRSGRRIRYLLVGDGPPLLMVHGWNGSAENFATWYDDIGAARTLILPDLPGCGESTRLTIQHDADSLSQALDAVLEDCGVSQIDLGGLCLGACVALSFYRRRPEMVDKLILHTPLIAPSLVHPRFRRQVKFFTSAPVFPLAIWAGRKRSISNWYKRNFTEGEVIGDTGSEMNYLNQCRCYARGARDWILDGLHRHDVGLLHDRTGPTLVMVAADDRIANVPGVMRLVGELPHVTLAIFDNAGHGWGQDLVNRQNQALVAFLAGQPLPKTSLRTVADVA